MSEHGMDDMCEHWQSTTDEDGDEICDECGARLE